MPLRVLSEEKRIAGNLAKKAWHIKNRAKALARMKLYYQNHKEESAIRRKASLEAKYAEAVLKYGPTK